MVPHVMLSQIKRVREFNEELIGQLFSQIGAEHVIPNRRFFEDEKNILLVAYGNSQPRGFLYAYLLEDIKGEQPKMFLYSIDVLESHRRKGIGTELIGVLKRVAKENSCSKIFVITNKSNVAAMALYKNTGGLFESDDDVVFVYQ